MGHKGIFDSFGGVGRADCKFRVAGPLDFTFEFAEFRADEITPGNCGKARVSDIDGCVRVFEEEQS